MENLGDRWLQQAMAIGKKKASLTAIVLCALASFVQGLRVLREATEGK